MNFLPKVGKARKPKFDVHLKIFDLNNIPLVSGNSLIKWHLSHSIHAEHRGRTNKCPITNHKVDYAYTKLITGVRISMDKNNNLGECPLEFEILQEFGLTEKITLGHIRLNLSEYIEESESISRDAMSPPSKRSSIAAGALSPTGGRERADSRSGPEEGIVRRYLMQESKINSTLKIGILMVQVDGERNFIAPPLKTAPVFGGIAAFVAPEVEDDASPIPSIAKSRDAAEVQDLYRRTLAASWSRQPNELPADECIEDIFSGGNGWRTKRESHSNHDSDDDNNNNNEGGGDGDEDDEEEPFGGTLRPSDFRRYANHQRSRSRHRRPHSACSDRSLSTVTGDGANGPGGRLGHRRGGPPHVEDSRDSRDDDAGSSRSGSLGSLAPTLGSSEGGLAGGRIEAGMRRAREVGEFEVRDDLVAWKLPGGVAV
ncbi:hypothetical protein E4U60_007078 [Claviceps pazoutovae]|uniref:C2 NT-type domain-containing protein n=1 Tax=Claviceps pazoutovae TaxID=1649127 RepID=A0A9P7SIZ0_9HYPO|nr:hypothetical protein E4U60_007078 [Claviceps pazoutovae]